MQVDGSAAASLALGQQQSHAGSDGVRLESQPRSASERLL